MLPQRVWVRQLECHGTASDSFYNDDDAVEDGGGGGDRKLDMVIRVDVHSE